MSDAAAAGGAPAPDTDTEGVLGIARGMVAHAAALAVQDAVDYQRNALAVCVAAQGRALAMMIEHPEHADQLAKAYALAQDGARAAGEAAAQISDRAGRMLESFPRR